MRYKPSMAVSLISLFLPVPCCGSEVMCSLFTSSRAVPCGWTPSCKTCWGTYFSPAFSRAAKRYSISSRRCIKQLRDPCFVFGNVFSTRICTINGSFYVQVWGELLRQAQQQYVVAASCPWMGAWLCLMMQAPHIPIDLNMLLEVKARLKVSARLLWLHCILWHLTSITCHLEPELM